jgi:hypothetical protein
LCVFAVDVFAQEGGDGNGTAGTGSTSTTENISANFADTIDVSNEQHSNNDAASGTNNVSAGSQSINSPITSSKSPQSNTGRSGGTPQISTNNTEKRDKLSSQNTGADISFNYGLGESGTTSTGGTETASTDFSNETENEDADLISLHNYSETKKDWFKDNFYLLIADGIIAFLIIIAFVVFIIIQMRTRKQNENDKSEYSKKLENLKQDLRELKESFEKFTVGGEFSSRLKYSEVQIVQKIEEKLQSIQQRQQIPAQKRPELPPVTKQYEAPPPLNALEAFNLWAASPSRKLDSRFFYVKNDIKIRQAQTLSKSDIETKWISNQGESERYLFPNPNTFNEMTDISEFYKISNSSQLKSKGQNRVKVTKPCRMTNESFIEYPGELTLL